MDIIYGISLGYFLIKGVTAGILAGIIREAVKSCYESGVNIRVVTMDGTQHNISAFEQLGCKLQPRDISQLNTTFPHPHPSANYSIQAFPDPPHMGSVH